mmetsp:Transcript_34846/g.26013  ORF Transcript_34846/g.26013 Transcript_34846/m.26013 type:complete len:99 (+) Transcript_34846:128-424(+)
MSMLNEFKFSCPKKCNFEGTQEQIQTHIFEECPNALIFCPRDCQAKVLRCEIETHKEVCPKNLKICSVCELVFPACESNAHDCITALKEALRQKEEMK